MTSTVPPHKVILASAGTGKTYQLSGRFLALLFAGVPPERILATTFTRKAAGEILDRVLKRLVQAAEDPEQLAALNRQLADEGQARVKASDCVDLLAALARGLHRFRIRTLDAFFVNLAGVFALELGLPAGWRILDEDEKTVLEREALSDALAHGERDLVLELLRALQKTDGGRTVERSLLRVVDTCRDAFLDASAEAWDRVNVPPGLDEEQMELALQALEAMPLPLKKDGTPDTNWVKARKELLELARNGAWEQALEKGLLAKVAAKQPSYQKRDFTEVHLELLGVFLLQAKHRLLATVRRQNLSSREWLTRFERAFFDRKDRASALSFEDVPRALAPADLDALFARGFDLGYRLDGSIDHLLLDEFQDTAPPQWRVIEPLASEILADGSGERSFFCVGDVKQSIYAWRSGEPRLLSGMNARYPALPPASELVLNWRSSPVVLDAVDRVFEGIAESRAFHPGGSDKSGLRSASRRSAARDFDTSYAKHVAARDLPGLVVLLEAPAAVEGQANDVPPLELAAERAAAIARDAPHATIAVLLRRNELVARTIDLLRRRGLRASGEGGNPLTDSAAVLHALSALHLADHPGDTAAAFHVATSPLASALEVSPEEIREPAGASRRLRARLARLGFGELLAELLPAVESAEGYGPWDAKRFAQLVDLGYSFDRREELRTTAFLDYARETKVDDPSSTQVKVMTIHGAKGLEFDAVLLPELDLSMTVRDADVLRQRPEPDREIQGVSVARKSAVCELDPEGLGAIQSEEDRRHVQEALCLLYVALTRAAHRLELIVRAPKQRSSTLSYATVVKEALLSTPSADLGDEVHVLWRHPDSSARWWPEPRTGDSATPAPALRRPRFAAPKAPRELPRKSPSAQEGGSAIEVRALLGARRAGLARGALIHRWLEEIEWLGDFARSDAELDALGAELERDAEQRASALAALRVALTGVELRALLTRPEGDVEVWRERSFSEILVEDGEPVLWSGTFDRVVVHREAGRAVRAEVIDFKTDDVEAGGVDARARFYAPQIEGYRRVLARMTGLALEHVTAALAFLTPGVVRSTPE